MNLLIQISVVVIVIALVALIYALVQTLKVLKTTLNEVRLTVGQLGTDMSQVTSEVKDMIHQTNAMTQDIRLKLSSLDILFTTVNDIGQTAHSFTEVMKETSASLVKSFKHEDSEEKQESPAKAAVGKINLAGAIMDGIQSTLRIWRKVKSV